MSTKLLRIVNYNATTPNLQTCSQYQTMSNIQHLRIEKLELPLTAIIN